MLLTATRHGDELLRRGVTVAQVIHDYGDLCQSITELAAESGARVTAEEFGVLNRCLDDAIAAAVTEFSLQRERGIEAEGTQSAEMQLGILAHELRNQLGAAMLSFEMIRRGSVAINGATATLHDRALRGLRNLIDHALTDVRLSIGIQRERMQLAQFIGEVEAGAAMEADALAMRLSVAPVDTALAIVADRQILASVMANLLQNAFKFTRANGRLDVSLRAHQRAGRVFIDVADECGGLPSGKADDLFRPFAQRGSDRTGLGLGLTICRRGVEANDGLLHVRDVPGHRLRLQRRACAESGTESGAVAPHHDLTQVAVQPDEANDAAAEGHHVPAVTADHQTHDDGRGAGTHHRQVRAAAKMGALIPRLRGTGRRSECQSRDAGGRDTRTHRGRRDGGGDRRRGRDAEGLSGAVHAVRQRAPLTSKRRRDHGRADEHGGDECV
ncbi:MAG TPA: HAMP domain-containing sensor histidine kinase [Gemmatimonadaceae bacterium]|nr:HAMP domain-containing sensor histidine kinase [Gemmatimonadaceae bacterium]